MCGNPLYTAVLLVAGYNTVSSLALMLCWLLCMHCYTCLLYTDVLLVYNVHVQQCNVPVFRTWCPRLSIVPCSALPLRCSRCGKRAETYFRTCTHTHTYIQIQRDIYVCVQGGDCVIYCIWTHTHTHTLCELEGLVLFNCCLSWTRALAYVCSFCMLLPLLLLLIFN